MDKLWIKAMTFFQDYWGCHQLPERSFFIGKYQMPICARCLGIIVGYITGIVLYLFSIKFQLYISILLMLIALIDWSLQFFNKLISTNIRRLITGICGGIGIIQIVLSFMYYIISLMF